MKIIFVDTTNDESFIGGGHLILPVIISGLVKKGHDVHLVVKAAPHQRIKTLIEKSGCQLHIKPWKKRGLINDIAPIFAEWINELNPDCYIISGSADIGWVVLPLLNTEIATLTIGHNDTPNFFAPVQHYDQFITQAIGVSEKICSNYINVSGMNPVNVKWIPYGVETSTLDKMNFDSQVLRIIYVGRIVEEQKKISDLIKVIQKLSSNEVSYKLNVVGDGPQMDTFKENLKDEIARGSVVLLGWVENSTVITTLRQSDVFILTSEFEGFSIALTEAMANGCCPVVTDIPSGSQSLIKNAKNGFLIKVGDVNEFTNKITFLSENGEVLKRMRFQALETGKKYNIEKMIDKYESCFADAKNKSVKQARVMNNDFPLMDSCISKYPDWIRRIKFLISSN